MSNPNKNRDIYHRLVQAFNDLSTGKSIDLGQTLDRAFILFLGGHRMSAYHPSSDFGRDFLKDLEIYCNLYTGRKKADIGGSTRPTTTEREALLSLLYATDIAKKMFPLLKAKNQLSNRIFHDIYNLSLSYVDAIVNGVSDEYIADKDAFNAKQTAIIIAKHAARVQKAYSEKGFSTETQNQLTQFSNALRSHQLQFMRDFELVATEQKSIQRKDEIISTLEQEVTREGEEKLLFAPSVIFPIAHGGTEIGVILSNAYENKGHIPITYPLMFSMKTRKHRKPWTQNDEFLRRSLEGHDVLVTEDWVTTGNTLRGILNEVEANFPHEVRVATIKRDPDKSKIPILDKYSFYVGQWTPYLGTKTDALADRDKIIESE
jgi:hypoxanthine phosphoribosyltransferase